MRLLRENVNALVVGMGFAVFEAGATARWSWAVAAMIGGSLLMLAGVAKYLRRRA